MKQIEKPDCSSQLPTFPFKVYCSFLKYSCRGNSIRGDMFRIETLNVKYFHPKLIK